MVQENEINEVKQDNKKTKSASLDLMLIKALACILIIIAVMVVKKNNTELFQTISVWYKENIYAQNLDLIEIKDKIYDFGNKFVNKAINSVNNLKE